MKSSTRGNDAAKRNGRHRAHKGADSVTGVLFYRKVFVSRTSILTVTPVTQSLTLKYHVLDITVCCTLTQPPAPVC